MFERNRRGTKARNISGTHPGTQINTEAMRQLADGMESMLMDEIPVKRQLLNDGLHALEGLVRIAGCDDVILQPDEQGISEFYHANLHMIRFGDKLEEDEFDDLGLEMITDTRIGAEYFFLIGMDETYMYRASVYLLYDMEQDAFSVRRGFISRYFGYAGEVYDVERGRWVDIDEDSYSVDHLEFPEDEMDMAGEEGDAEIIRIF